jgi:hypothetical protein
MMDSFKKYNLVNASSLIYFFTARNDFLKKFKEPVQGAKEEGFSKLF